MPAVHIHAALYVFVTLVQLFAPQFANAIINGKMADEKSYGATVLVRDATTPMICTGTAISEHQILTDAHCIAENGAPYAIVGGQIFTVAAGKAIYPEDYSMPGYTRVDLVGMFSTPKVNRRCPEGYYWDDDNKRCHSFQKDFGIIEVNEPLPEFRKLATSAPAVGDCIKLVGYGLLAIGDFFGGETTPGMNEMIVGDPDLRYGYNTLSKIDGNMLKITGPAVQIRQPVFIQDQTEMDNFLLKAKSTKSPEPENTMISFGDSGGAVYNSKNEIIALTTYISGSEFGPEKLDLEKRYLEYNVIPNFTASMLRTDTPEFRAGLAALQNRLQSAQLANVNSPQE